MRRGHVIVGIALAAGVAALYALRQSLGLDFDPDSLRATVSRAGIWAPLVYVAIVAFRVPLALPSAVVLIGGGALFGTLPAAAYGAFGMVLSASFLFFAARVTGREAITARMPDRMRPFFELAGTRAGALVLGLGTGYPSAPATMFHLLAGVTGMAFWVFLPAVACGCLLRAGIYTYFGSQLVGGDLGGLGMATTLLVATIVLPLLFPRSRAWLLQALRRDPLAPGERKDVSTVRRAPKDAPPGPA